MPSAQRTGRPCRRGRARAYVDEGAGEPVFLLHGNPSSSYQWRNVIPYLTDLGRCIAPDLIGMGDSAKVTAGVTRTGSSRIAGTSMRSWRPSSARASDSGAARLGLGAGLRLGVPPRFRVRGIAYMEAFVAAITSWSDWPEQAVATFQAIRSPAGEEMVLDHNFFVEEVLPNQVMRGLSESEMAAYRRPYLEPGESRRPTLTWPREIPVAGEPQDVHDVIIRYASWLAESTVPKLFIEALPGGMFETHREIARSWPNQVVATVTAGHMVPEDAPDEVGAPSQRG